MGSDDGPCVVLSRRPDGATEPLAYTSPVDGTHSQGQASRTPWQAAVGGSVAAVAVPADESYLIPAEESGAWHPADGETAADLARLTASFPTPRAAVASSMDTFPTVRRKDEAQFDGDYRTRRVILDIYDALAESIRTGQPYQTRLDPPPADPRCCHPLRATMPQHGHAGPAGTDAQQPTALQSVS